MIFEPKWKSLMANTIAPIFSPAQCQDIINMGHQQKAQDAKVGTSKKEGKYDTKMRITTISWIPFKVMPDMYKRIERVMNQVNRNHFGYKITLIFFVFFLVFLTFFHLFYLIQSMNHYSDLRLELNMKCHLRTI